MFIFCSVVKTVFFYDAKIEYSKPCTTLAAYLCKTRDREICMLGAEKEGKIGKWRAHVGKEKSEMEMYDDEKRDGAKREKDGGGE